MKKAVLTTILMAFCLMPLHAQIFKNLKGAGVQQVDPSEIPQVYDFEWSYVMKMETRQGDMILNYYLKKDAPYFGMKLPENDMYMVLDRSRNLNIMYMRSEGHNMVMATKMPKTLPDEIVSENAESDEFSFKKIANKTILGYDCEGYQGENSDMVFTFYLTTEPDISFGEMYKSDQTKLPKGFDPKWIKDGMGIMMHMTMEGKKNTRDNATMTCIALEKKNFSLNKSDYKSLPGR